MEIQNNKEQVPFEYYEDLFRKIDPAEVAARLPDVSWDGMQFRVTLLGREYAIGWPDFTIAEDVPMNVRTFLLRYLMESKAVAWQGTWKTFREMPWGEMYIKPYTGRVLTRAAFTFGTRLGAFKAACEKLGATALPHGDAGYQFDFVGGYGVQILVWEGDEEFPPNAQVIYTDNFESGFAPEDRVVVGDILITAIKANM